MQQPDERNDSIMVATLTKQSSREITLPCFKEGRDTFNLTKIPDEAVNVYGIRPLDMYTSMVMALSPARMHRILEILSESDDVQKLVSYLAEEGRFAWLKTKSAIILCNYEKEGDAYMLLSPVAIKLSVTSPDVDILTAMLSILKQ